MRERCGGCCVWLCMWWMYVVLDLIKNPTQSPYTYKHTHTCTPYRNVNLNPINQHKSAALTMENRSVARFQVMKRSARWFSYCSISTWSKDDSDCSFVCVLCIWSVGFVCLCIHYPPTIGSTNTPNQPLPPTHLHQHAHFRQLQPPATSPGPTIGAALPRLLAAPVREHQAEGAVVAQVLF